MEAKTREAVIEQGEESHRRQMRIALDSIFALHADYGAMLDVLSHALDMAHTHYATISFEARINRKVIGQLIEEKREHKSQLRAILDTDRDGRLAPADMERLKELAK